ncbi:hypothetical protein NEPAR04_1211 [Nematocida parisii]|nr:hypothetical protein NEPAR03_0106 [Nematocida parisii]KAI5125555.1 hypothetical protein NEPAR08_0106 [Nematocida parisii]KAI5141824.1 hypothetical protein NEPAR04_1211 [Nematocida parisii]
MNNNTDGKDTLLNKMKKAKSFFDTVPTEKKPLLPQEIKLKEPEKTVSSPAKPAVPEQPLLFSAHGTLYKKQEAKWVEISPGQIQGKPLPNKRVQLLFVLNNTRIVLNLLILDISHIKITGSTVVFTGLDENKQPCTGCVRISEKDAQAIEETIKEEQKSSCI